MAFRTVVDVGANEGQFSSWAREMFPRAEIHAFEPVPSSYSALKARFADDRRLTCYCLAVGAGKGDTTIFADAFSPSSSLLKQSKSHREHFPWTGDVKEQRIQMVRLDETLGGRELEEPILLKADVQGYEDQVLRGAESLLPRIACLLLEVSFSELYVGQLLFEGLQQLVHGYGFRYRGNLDQLTSPTDGEILQADAIFTRT